MFKTGYRRTFQFLALLALSGSIFCYPSLYGNASFSPEMMLRCRKLMPTGLKRLLMTREALLMDGYRRASAGSDKYSIRKELDAEIQRLVRLLRSTINLDESVAAFGRVARLTCEYQSWAQYASDDKERIWLDDFFIYFKSSEPKFVPVFHDYSPLLFRENRLGYFLDQMEQAVASRTAAILRQYQAGGNSNSFDDRSPAFGLASQHFSHSITELANLWLYCWWQANGNMEAAPFFPFSQRQYPDEGDFHE